MYSKYPCPYINLILLYLRGCLVLYLSVRRIWCPIKPARITYLTLFDLNEVRVNTSLQF